MYRGGSTCGFYKIGGYDSTNSPVAISELLPRFTDCGDDTDVGWLSENPAATTLAPGQSVTISVTLASGGSSANQPGTYTASLIVVNTTPYHIVSNPIAVTMKVTPPKTWGEITGMVTGLACDGSTEPLPGATVQVNGKSKAANWTLTTDANGRYALWLDQSNNPLTVVAALDGWQSQARRVTITTGRRTTASFTLRNDACT